MASYTSNLKDWGASGSEYPNGYNYVEGEQPVDDWDNFVTANIINDIKDHLIPLTNGRVESSYGSSGDEPSNPEASHLYHDQVNERLELWDSDAESWRDIMFRDGDQMTGVLDMGGYQIRDSTGELTLAGTVNFADRVEYDGDEIATQQWAGNQIVAHSDVEDSHHTRYDDSEARQAVDGSGVSVQHANQASNADTVDNQDWNDIQNWVNTSADVPNASHADEADNADTVDGHNVYVQDSAPQNASQGDIWIDTSNPGS